MPKITYPRPCPTCGKPLSKSQFHYHKKVCSGYRYQCTHCSLSFANKWGLQHHVEQQHSPNPPRFYCPKCYQGFTTKYSRNLHLETVQHKGEFLVTPSFKCDYCPATFTRKGNRQMHMRAAHGRICRERNINLLLHLRPLSHNPNCRDEWMFVKSRRIAPRQTRVCPCGQTHIRARYYMNNEHNDNQTWVGSTCIHHIDPRVGDVIAYFERLLMQSTQGIYRGKDGDDMHSFQVCPTTTLVKGACDVVKHLNPPVFRQDGKCYVTVKDPRVFPSLRLGHMYRLWLEADYEQRHLLFTIVRCREFMV